MEKFILKSMTDFVLEQLKITQSNSEFKSSIKNYAEFLKQPLELGMFVPCDEDGNLIDVNSRYTSDYEHLNKELDKRYQQAKKHCIFNNNSLSLDQVNRLMHNCKNIETLITYYYERTGNYLETSIRI